jgi:hypothetical protein
MTDFKFASETIELPSRGWYYSEGHPLASGKLDVYYMTAHHEDILTSRNLIQKGTVIDKLLESLIATPEAKYGDLLIGDKNALMIASRIMGYGKNYDVTVPCSKCEFKNDVTINLEECPEKNVPTDTTKKGQNCFEFTLPFSKKVITFKILTHQDEQDASKEIEALKKAERSEVGKEVTTRMTYSILSVDGDPSKDTVRKFVEVMPARDAAAFREYGKSIAPDIDLSFNFECSECDHTERMEVPMGVTFFWPHVRV